MLDDARTLGHGVTPRCVAGMILSARMIPDLSGSTNSGGFARVVFQKSAKPFTTPKRAFTREVLVDCRKEEHVALALMIPFMVKMLHILRQRIVERRFPEEDHP